VKELVRVHETSFRRILRPILWNRPEPWVIRDVLSDLTTETFMLCEVIAHALELLSLHLIEQVDGVMVNESDFRAPFESVTIMDIYKTKILRGNYDHGRHVPVVIQEKFNNVKLYVLSSHVLKMVTTHTRHLKENYYLYYRRSLVSFIKERCLSLSRRRFRQASVIISVACHDRADGQLLHARRAVCISMISRNYEFRQIAIGVQACAEVFRFRSKGVSYAKTLEKMRVLLLHLAAVSLIGQGVRFPFLPQF